MKGGKFIGRGSYGCVFKPALPCSDKKTHPTKVGKIFFDTEGFNDEKKVADILQKIDPEQKNLIYPVDKKCTVTKDKVLEEDTFDDCEISNNYRNSYSQMIMDYGGLSMTDYLETMKTKMTRHQAASMLVNVFSAVELLVKNKMAHQDIKPDNVVIDSMGQSKLIDFGFLTKFTKFSKNFLFYHEYFVNGPEYRILLYQRDLANTLWHLKNNLRRYCFLEDWKSSGLDIVDDHYVESLRDYLKKTSKYNPEKVDIYSLGILTGVLYPYLIPASKDDPRHVKMFNDLLYRLLRPDPKDRPTASEAVSILNKILSSTKAISHPTIKNRTPKLVLPTAPGKECPPEKVLNPATGRCVKADGKIGRALALAAEPTAASAAKPTKKECPEGKVLNPATGRCVKADGKIGRALALK